MTVAVTVTVTDTLSTKVTATGCEGRWTNQHSQLITVLMSFTLCYLEGRIGQWQLEGGEMGSWELGEAGRGGKVESMGNVVALQSHYSLTEMQFSQARWLL